MTRVCLRPLGGRRGDQGQGGGEIRTESRGEATGLSSSTSALLLWGSSEVRDLDSQGDGTCGERKGVQGWVPPVLDHPLALGAWQVVFLPPQRIGVKPEGQAIV